MSVVIKGMKMPESCQACNVSVKFCDLWLKLSIEDKCKLRHPDCPLCELPEKHGRLIDADDFLNFLQALTKNGAPYQSVMELLDKSQEIIVATEGERENNI